MSDLTTDVRGRPLAGSGALFSPCETYRYRLWRRWDEGACLLFIMLNPSTADEVKNDPTVERCERRARALGYGAVEVVNLFALRSPDPVDLVDSAEAGIDPVGGQENDRSIIDAVRAAGSVVCAWGAHGSLYGRAEAVKAMIRPHVRQLYVLGLTKGGEPRHPLYIKSAAPLIEWGACL